MSTPIPPEKFVSLIPSSKASPKPSDPPARHYTISVQRKERSGRWNQVATWSVSTDEPDMAGPLQMGLKPNYRILVNEGKPPPLENADVHSG
jgi:hypothetical protein